MLAFQHISPHFGGQHHQETRIKRSMSPADLCSYKREPIEFARMRRRSLSRPSTPISPHSPSYSYMRHVDGPHMIKRSVSEEDLRLAHERRRLSIEHEHEEYQDRPRHQIIRPVVSYHHQHIQNRFAVATDNDSDYDSKNNINIHDDTENNSEQVDVEADDPDEINDDVPLDLSMHSKKRRGRTDSGTDSDDSTGMGEEGRGNEGRAYKKSLMKRYCKYNYMDRYVDRTKKIIDRKGKKKNKKLHGYINNS